MAYRFQLDHTVESNVHRILSEQLEKAVHQLTQNFDQQPADAIHDARKRLKKGRSLLRLIRKSIDQETYQYEKNQLRQVGHSLAPARDGEAYQETLDTLLERYALTLDIGAFADLQESIADLHQGRLQQLSDRDELMDEMVSSLKDSSTRLNQLGLEKTGWNALRKNLKRIYRQGQERFQTAYEEGSDTAFHEWRKRVKDLWYDMRLLQPIWPPVMKAFKAEAHQLSKYLGDDHDVAELRDFLQKYPESVAVQEVHMKVLVPLMGHYQSSLRQQAWHSGQRLYAEAPDAFIERIERYWQIETAA